MFSGQLRSTQQAGRPSPSPSASCKPCPIVSRSSSNSKVRPYLAPSSSQSYSSGPTAAQISKSLSAVQKGSKQRGQPIQGEPFRNENSRSDSSPESLSNIEHEIKHILLTKPEANGPKGFLSLLRGAIVRRSIANMNIETGAFEGQFDADIRVLCQVIDELVRTGEAHVGEEIIRPWHISRKK